jgi:hypothetical protein
MRVVGFWRKRTHSGSKVVNVVLFPNPRRHHEQKRPLHIRMYSYLIVPRWADGMPNGICKFCERLRTDCAIFFRVNLKSSPPCRIFSLFYLLGGRGGITHRKKDYRSVQRSIQRLVPRPSRSRARHQRGRIRPLVRGYNHPSCPSL